MFLAPLNYDRFFKKIFSDKNIAKRFLEDFFEVVIEEIGLVSLDHKLTNEANLLKFDFRCKIDGEYVIVDMQQWYKQDIIQRFYLYHTANTVLQLEDLPTIQPTKEKKVKDYRLLLPVKTLIWLVDDNLKLEDDFSIHQMLPSELLTFLLDEGKWQEATWKTALESRAKIIRLLNNEAKNLPFLRSNQLIFAFQSNIVKNKKVKPYFKWFDFAEKTRDENNKEQDFDNYIKDGVFTEMIRKLSHKSLDAEDLTFIKYYRLLEGQKEVWEEQYREEGKQMGLEEGKYKKAIETACQLKKMNVLTDEQIAEATGLSLDEVARLEC